MLVEVDSGFITLLTALIPLVGLIMIFIGIFIMRSWIGPAARMIWLAKRKRYPLILHMGRDGIWRLLPAKRSPSGVWSGLNSQLLIIPDERAVRPLSGATALAVVHTLSAGTLNPEFLYYAQKLIETGQKGFTTLRGVKERFSPYALAEYFEFIYNREREVISILQLLERLKKEEITIEDAVTQILTERQLPVDDENLRQQYKRQLENALATQGEAYQEELRRLQEAKKVTIEQKNWYIETEEVKEGKKTRLKIKDVVAYEPLVFDDFYVFLPSGANIDDVFSSIKRSEAAALKEQQFTTGQAFKWLTFGVVILLILIGVYVVLKGVGI
jgi:hypothetical protein